MSDPLLLSVGTSTPPDSFSQQELLDRFSISDERISSIFANSHIDRRNLYIPSDLDGDTISTETQAQLLQKHLDGALDMGIPAIESCLDAAGLAPQDIDYLCCVTTTGFLCPGLSAYFIRRMGFKSATSRVDVVGMGCNAGLNGLNPVVAWAARNPGRYALQLCVEVCSAAYIYDGTMRTAVVNALFGDGAAAVLVGTQPAPGRSAAPLPRVLSFSSEVITDAIDAMRFDWDEKQSKYSFFLDPDIPYVVGATAALPLRRLLGRHDLNISDIDHWIVHSGGKKVIDGLKYNLDLTDHDLRHTRSVLRDHGNLSSSSFLFSYQRLLHEGDVSPGDVGVMMTMGPGTTIEAVLLQW